MYLSCSLTKRTSAGAHLALSQVAKLRAADGLHVAMGQWQKAIEAIAAAKRVRAIELYGGGVWGILRAGEKRLREAGIEIRIVSAGLGLLSPDDKVPAYDATFAPGGKNSIGGAHGAVARNRGWWKLLGEWQRGWVGPRSLHATVKQFPNAAHVVALPSDYLDAVLEDVRAIMNDPECIKRTLVLAAPYYPASRWIPGMVQIPGDLYGALGGTRGTVLARAGLFLAGELKGDVIDPAAVTKALKPLHAKAKPLPVRTVQSDAKVSQFIRAVLRQNPGTGRTPLLAKFRAEGFACERTRFLRLYQAVNATL